MFWKSGMGISLADRSPVAGIIYSVCLARMPVIQRIEMDRFKTIVAILMLGSVTVANPAYAEIIDVRSKIIEINSSTIAQYLKVYQLDPQTKKTEEIKVEVSDSTLFDGVKSLQDLNVDDEVVIVTNFDPFTHEWKAQSIRLYKQT